MLAGRVQKVAEKSVNCSEIEFHFTLAGLEHEKEPEIVIG
jgi:hypothetical protein